MKVGTKLALITGITICIVLVVGLTSYLSVSKLIEADSWTNHSRDVLQNLHFLLFNMTEAESTQRAYIITGKPEYLEAYHSASTSALETMREIKNQIRDNQSQTNRAKKLESSIADRLGGLDVTLQLYKTKGMDSAFEHIRNGQTWQFRSAIRTNIDDMKQEELRLLKLRDEAMHSNATASLITIVSGCLLALAFVSIYNFLFGTYIVNSVKALVRASENIEHGRFGASVYTGTKDEFGDLAAAFTNLGLKLQTITDSLSDEKTDKERILALQKSAEQRLSDLIARIHSIIEVTSREDRYVKTQTDRLSELQRATEGILGSGRQAESSARTLLGHANKLFKSQERVCELGRETSSRFATAQDLYKTSSETFENLNHELDTIGAVTASIDAIINQIDVVSTTADMESTRSEGMSRTSVLFERVKLICENARRDKLEIQRGLSRISSLSNKCSLSQVEVGTAMETSKIGAQQLIAEIQRQEDPSRELEVALSGIHTLLQDHLALLVTHEHVSEYARQQLEHNKTVVGQIQLITSETKWNQPSTLAPTIATD